MTKQISKNTVGVYVHTPFCDGKCPYCDFYSVMPTDALRRRYIGALVGNIRRYADREEKLTADTVYFGGGTPLTLGADGLAEVLAAVRDSFALTPDAEITVEVNPRSHGDGAETLSALRQAGFNRLSMGAQSGVDSELEALGRRHTASCVREACADARAAGFDNLSLDLMLCIPGQTAETLRRSVDFIAECAPEHVSAYILKLEPGTPFYRMKDSLCLPDDDAQADMYLDAVRLLGERGYGQYEISNFCRPGMESRHNLRYWDDREYIGFGPSAHSFFGGRRFYYPRDLEGYISAPRPVDDGEGGYPEEYAMLRLRLTEGLTGAGWLDRFGEPMPQEMFDRAERFAKVGLVRLDRERMSISLTPEGFLVSNAIIAELIG